LPKKSAKETNACPEGWLFGWLERYVLVLAWVRSNRGLDQVFEAGCLKVVRGTSPLASNGTLYVIATGANGSVGSAQFHLEEKKE
jgi:hypothetical protein